MSITSDIVDLYRIACKSDSTVLITGATGTGKTSLARRIHENSLRKNGPFIVINLASLHEGTLESELFGHERGAFTGAHNKKVGKLDLAQGGTVFLDEVGELSPKLQARLLEFLQSKTIAPVGGTREVRLNVRVIAATHRDLSHSVAKGEFREDLFHRLRVVPIQLKSLKERSDELEQIILSCLAEVVRIAERPIPSLHPQVMMRFKAYDWPGNIRELKNVLEYAVLATDAMELTLASLPMWFLNDSNSKRNESTVRPPLLGVVEVPMTLDYAGTLADFEREYLRRALGRNQGRINKTARSIGMNKTTLIRRMRVYGLYEQAQGAVEARV